MSPRRHRASLRVRADGSVTAAASGDFAWHVHHGCEPIAFLVSSLAALGSGETLAVEVELEPGARAVVTGQGPSALLATDAPARVEWSLRVAGGALLTHLPWTQIPFPESRSAATLDVELAEGGRFLGWDLLAAGRVGRGERYRMAELSTSTTVRHAGETLLAERLLVRGADAAEAETACAGNSHLGSLLAAGITETELPLGGVRATLADMLAGASRPHPALVLARALGHSAEAIERAFWPVLATARERLGAAELDPARVGRRWF